MLPLRSTVALIAALLVTGSAGGPVLAEQARSGPELLTVAEQSFSPVPFGAPRPQPGLTRVEDEGCVKFGECTYRDTNLVGHYFGDCCNVGALVVKSIDVADVGDRPIAALGIGEARSMSEVVERVQRFLPEVELDCEDYREPTPVGEAASDVAYGCNAMLGEGWIQVFFDNSQRLTIVRIDAYHFT